MHQFLKNAGALELAVGLATDTAAGVCPLPERGWLTIAGPEANTFMQGQFTCDVNEITTIHSLPGAHCTPKGRMMGSFRISQIAEHGYLLGLPSNNVDALRTHIGKYIVFSKAEVETSSQHLAFGLWGDEATIFLNDYFGSAPKTANEQVVVEGGVCIRLPSAGLRYEVWVEREQAEDFWRKASAALPQSNAPCWALANIRDRLVEIESGTADEIIPQSIGLERLEGVSFSKGCYTGQEIVARTKYLGKLKRQLFEFSAQDKHPGIGSIVISADNGQAVGLVVAAVDVAETSSRGLAVINQKAVGSPLSIDETGTVLLDLTTALPEED